MSQYKTINGFTKESMKAAIRAGNNGKRATWPYSDTCSYKTPDGNKCAVGCFLPEGGDAQGYYGTAPQLLRKFPLLETIMPLHIEGLTAMQCIHDLYRGHEDMRDVLCRWIDSYVIDGGAV